MDALLLVTVFAAIGLGLFVWWLLVLIEALRTPTVQWDAAGQSQLLYVLLMVLVGIIGTIVYVLVARPELRRVGSAGL